MSHGSADLRMYLITGERRGAELENALTEALGALPQGSAAVQIRAKELASRPLLDLTRRAIDVSRPRRAPVFVNERLDIALAAGADGVHLPESGLRIADARSAAGTQPLLVGASTHSPADARTAADAGADFVVLGPIFETPSKAGLGQPLGPGALGDAARSLAEARSHTRLFALGGITDSERARTCTAAGAHGIAAIRAILDAPDPGPAAARLWNTLT